MRHKNWAMVMLAQPVTVYEIITFKLSKLSVFESMTLKKGNITSYNVGEYVSGWRFNGLHDGEKMADLSQIVIVRSTNEVFTRANTHTHTHKRTQT